MTQISFYRTSWVAAVTVRFGRAVRIGHQAGFCVDRSSTDSYQETPNGSSWPTAALCQIIGQRDDSAWSRAVRLSGQLIGDFAIASKALMRVFFIVFPRSKSKYFGKKNPGSIEAARG